MYQPFIWFIQGGLIILTSSIYSSHSLFSLLLLFLMNVVAYNNALTCLFFEELFTTLFLVISFKVYVFREVEELQVELRKCLNCSQVASDSVRTTMT